MTKTAKAVISIVIVIIILAAIWWYSSRSAAPSNITLGTDTSQTSNSLQAEQHTQTSTSQVQPVAKTVTAIDNSDAALNQDLSAIDGQMNTLNSDSAKANPSAI